MVSWLAVTCNIPILNYMVWVPVMGGKYQNSTGEVWDFTDGASGKEPASQYRR